MATTYRVIVRGTLPGGLVGVLRRRFGDVGIAPATDRTLVGCIAVECTVADQSALRALLTQMWDVGGEVVLLTAVPRGALQEESP